MKTIEALITRAGGFEAVSENYISLTNDPYMRLVVEVVRGPFASGAYEVSVAHYGEQNGDAMRDPEILFHVQPDPHGWVWTPLWIQQDYLGSFRVSAKVTTQGDLQVLRPRLLASVLSFSRLWSRNLKHQGFLQALPVQA